MHEWNFREFGCPCFFDILFTVTASCLHTKDQEMARKLLPRDFSENVLSRTVTPRWNLSRTENKTSDLAIRSYFIRISLPFAIFQSIYLHREFFIHFQTVASCNGSGGDYYGSRVFYKKFSIQSSLEIRDGIEYLTSRFEFENPLPYDFLSILLRKHLVIV